MSFKLNVFILSIIFDNQQLNICLLQLSDLKIGGEWWIEEVYNFLLVNTLK